ncbi:hypothetical protein HOC80_02825 [archaeon]|mgnify:FL=1|jgi:hypothetical protein|nr:hypothetical protein [archaeon]MBT4417015.1 hypothetical protein [archaeon]
MKRKIIGSVAGIGLATALGCSEESGIGYHGFPELESGNWEVTDIRIPTRGSINNVWRLEDKTYSVTLKQNGDLNISGQYKYEIRESYDLIPDGRVLEGEEKQSFWVDERHGTVTLREVEE